MKVLSLPIANRAHLVASALVFVGAICFAAKAVLVKLAYRYGIDTISLLALRMLFSLPFFIAIAIFSGRKTAKEQSKTAPPITRKDWLHVGLLGLAGYYFASLFDFLGLQYISASLERLILFIYPTLVVLIAFLVFRKKINTAQAFALSLTYIGIVVAFLEQSLQANNAAFFKGTFFVFLSALVYAIYLIGAGRVISRFGIWRFTSWAMISASTAILLHHGVLYQWRLFHFPAEVYGLVILMAVFATVLPSFLVSEGLRTIGSNNTAIISSVSPIATIVLARGLLAEQFTWLQWLGTLLVISGVALTSIQKK